MTREMMGIAAGLGSALGWAVGAILFKRLGESLSPVVMAFGKCALSVVFLGAGLLLAGGRIPSLPDAALLAASGIVGIAVADVLFFAALRELSPQILVIFLTVGQVITAVLAMLFLGETPALMAWIGMAFILCGVSLVLWPKERGLSQAATRKGILYGLLASGCMSASMVMAKGALSEVSALEGTFLRMSAGFIGLSLWLGARRQLGSAAASFSKQGLAVPFILSVCVITFAGFWLSLVAVKNLDVAPANSLLSLEPILVLPLAATILKEKIFARDIAGAVVATLGVVLLCFAYAPA